MADIADFLIALAERADTRTEFESNPRAAMTAFGLDEDQQELILSRDEPAIARACKETQAKIIWHSDDDADVVWAKIIVHADDEDDLVRQRAA